MIENESMNINNYNNQTYIKTNKDDINSLENLKNSMQVGLNNNNNIDNLEENNILNDNNNFFNSNFNLFSPFGMAGMYMMGGQNTFFDKLFMTLERANYQMYHLCEMIKLIKKQKPTITFFKSLIISIFKTIKEKYIQIINMIKDYFIKLKNIFTFDNDKYIEEDLKNHIKIIDYIIKILLGILLIIISFYII